jgi:hypothetical protein
VGKKKKMMMTRKKVTKQEIASAKTDDLEPR